MNPPQTKSWRILRRCLVGLGIFVTLIGLFYTEELWRGKRAWEKCKHALEAQGVDFNWADYIPAPVPEKDNVFGVPEMKEWFPGRHGGTELSKKLMYPGFIGPGKPTVLIIAELMIGLPGMPAPEGSIVLRWDDPAAPAAAAKAFTNALGPTVITPAGPGLMARRPEEIRPARIFLQCQSAPTEKDMQRFLSDPILGILVGPLYRLRLGSDGKGSYRADLFAPASAPDYLAWCETLDREFGIIHQALQRPVLRMEGDYADPVEMPLPNYVTIRSISQMLGARAQCHLMLGQPDEALRDVTLLNDSRRLMSEMKPMMLVTSMVEVAVTGLYINIIADGMRLQAWREPQLAALEGQLKSINLLQPVKQSFETQAVYSSRNLETATTAQIEKVFTSFSSHKINSWTALECSIFAELIPRGWVFQNIVTSVDLDTKIAIGLDAASQIVYPDKINARTRKSDAVSSHWSPNTILASRIAPRFGVVCQTTALNQTVVNQGLVACALERYHLAHGEYPDTLNALIPEFLDRIPHDVVGGQPPHYHRAADGTFLLYSIGWNGRDNGGVRGKSNADGDWVWPN
ncbi:MAG: hypothetical protein ABSA83_20960 [Verrucomicrobiota bacterium]|jgi:hypothetical protein